MEPEIEKQWWELFSTQVKEEAKCGQEVYLVVNSACVRAFIEDRYTCFTEFALPFTLLGLFGLAVSCKKTVVSCAVEKLFG
jgi:hypothetical protein